MANPPPPYSDITGISRTVMKDNAQESIGNYNGNARPGEMVVDLTNNNIYIGNTNGNLTLINTGGGSGNAEPAGAVGAVQYNAGGNLFGASANLTFLNNVLSVVGNVTTGNIISNTIVSNGSGNIYHTGNLLPSAVNYTLGTLDVPWGNAFFGPQSVTILDSTGNIGNIVTIENIAANITLGTAGFDIVKLGTADSIFRIEALTGQIFSFANTIIENDTNATDAASGSLQTLGGAAIAQDLYVGSNIYSNGVTVGGSVLVQDGNQNNIIELQTDGNIVFNGGSTLNLNGGFHVSSVSTNSGDANIVNYVGGAFVYGPALKDYAGNLQSNNLTTTGKQVISTLYQDGGGTQGTATPIDLTKQVHIFADSWFSLADGAQGQIMHFAMNPGGSAEDIIVDVAHLRISQAGAGNTINHAVWHPFPYGAGNHVATLATAIFTDGAWNVNAGTVG